MTVIPTAGLDLSEPTMRSLLMGVGYSEQEARAWLESGFIAVDTEANSLPQLSAVLSSEPIDLVALECALSKYVRTAPARHRGVVLVDTYSGSALTPPEIGPSAIWGRKGTDSHRWPLAAGPVRFGRVRFNRVPYYLARDASSFLKLAYACLSASGKQDRIFFRGQTCDYSINREPSIREFLFGDAGQREVSIPTTAFRSSYNYVAHEPFFRNLIFDIEYRCGGNECRWCWVEDKYEEISITPGKNVGTGNFIGVAAIAQHYGIPTYGLDSTRSPELAWWFATHKFEGNSDAAWYRPHQWHDRDQEHWPVVYVFETSHYVVLKELELPRCQRPTAQQAVFICGGHSAHGNVCAADLVAVIVLSPQVGVIHTAVEAVFPPPDADPMYKELLALRAAASGDASLREKTGLQRVFALDYANCDA